MSTEDDFIEDTMRSLGKAEKLLADIAAVLGVALPDVDKSSKLRAIAMIIKYETASHVESLDKMMAEIGTVGTA